MVDGPHYDDFARALGKENPDVVFTQWPLDRHRDHQDLGALTLDAWLKAGGRFALYYYEVAEDTLAFTPSDYVDISRVEPLRHDACYAHASQNPGKWYPKQVEITRFSRARRAGFPRRKRFSASGKSRRALLP